MPKKKPKSAVCVNSGKPLAGCDCVRCTSVRQAQARADMVSAVLGMGMGSGAPKAITSSSPLAATGVWTTGGGGGGGGGGVGPAWSSSYYTYTTTSSWSPLATTDQEIEVGRHALRTFRVQAGTLASVFKNNDWDPSGVAIAQCLSDDPHHPQRCWTTPNFDCHCGIYGSLTIDKLFAQYESYVKRTVAVIAAEGPTIIGDTGLRTSAARIVAYWCARPSDRQVYAGCKDACCFDKLNDMLKEYDFEPWVPPMRLGNSYVKLTPDQMKSTLDHIKEITGGTLSPHAQNAINHALSFLGDAP